MVSDPGPEGATDFVVSFGDEQWVGRNGKLMTSLRELPRAEFELTWDDIVQRPPDYLAPVAINVGSHRAFTGNVIRAKRVPGAVRVECMAGMAMTENPLPTWVSEDCHAVELIYAAARGAGFDEEHVDIEGLDQLRSEPVEVVVALEGVAAENSFGVGGITVRGPAMAHDVLSRFKSVPDDLARALEGAEALAVAIRHGQRLWDVEQAVLEGIRLGLAWLATRVRFGHAIFLDGAPEDFARQMSRTLPRLGRAVAVRGLRSSRRWIRHPDELSRPGATHPSLDPTLLRPALKERPSRLTEMAVLRAADAFVGELGSRVLAFYDAWEFYAAAAPSRKIFSTAELRCLRGELPDRLPSWLDSAQRARILELMDLANSQPLKDRMAERLAADGARISTQEWAVLDRLRKARNHLAHGRDAPCLTIEDLEWGCSILSRALVSRVAHQDGSSL